MSSFKCSTRWLTILAMLILAVPYVVVAQSPITPQQSSSDRHTEATDEYNQKLEQLLPPKETLDPEAKDYRIGTDDLLDISVFEATELNRTVRVSADGNISLPLIGNVRAAGLTAAELERALEELLGRTYMKEPHVGVFVKEPHSHAVSVFGAVRNPGVFQILGSKTLIEMLSMAGGPSDDAGDTVIVMRHSHQLAAAEHPSSSIAGSDVSIKSGATGDSSGTAVGSAATPGESATEINLKNVLESGDPQYNVQVNPGDVIKVTRAGVVYVVGEVKRPGGFTLKTNENISVLQALALAEGLTRTSAKSKTRIIRTDELTGARSEIPIDLGKILGGKAADPELHSKDIVFIPNSTGRSALYTGSQAAVSIASGLIIYRP